jgi:hypothetical protein
MADDPSTPSAEPYEWNDEDRPHWDEEFSVALIGSRVLVGVTHVASDGSCRQEQMFGIVACVDRENGVTLVLEGTRSGERFVLPPHLESFHPAAPGEYRLRSTGEFVVDPEYTSSWTVQAPKH